MRTPAAIILGLTMLACSSKEDADDDGASAGGTSSATGGTASGSGGDSSSGGAASGTGATSTGAASTGGSQSGSGGSAQTSGCGQSSPTGEQDRTVQIAGAERSYLLSVPDDYDSSTAYPLIFAWHGLGGNGPLARQYFGLQGQASDAAILVYPTALPNQEGNNAWDLSPSGVDVELFDTLLASLSAEYCVDTGRVFSTGHSYGGYMTNRLGCSRGDVLRAVAPVAGGPPFGGGGNTPCVGEVAAFLVHGTFDETVDVEQGIAARDRYVTANGCATTSQAVTPAPCAAFDGCQAGLPVTWCEHDTTGTQAHGWPSFTAAGIWSFFTGLD